MTVGLHTSKKRIFHIHGRKLNKTDRIGAAGIPPGRKLLGISWKDNPVVDNGVKLLVCFFPDRLQVVKSGGGHLGMSASDRVAGKNDIVGVHELKLL